MNSIDYYRQTNYPRKVPLSFSCPTCHNGNIKITEKEITKKKTAAERKLKDNLDYTDATAFKFVSMPVCDFCGEVVIVCGDAGYYNLHGNPVSRNFVLEKHTSFTPKYFYPPLNIFPISSYCPREIKLCILNAFSHYWNDLPSTINRIRTCVELIMDDRGIEKTGTLHSRIMKYQVSNPILGKRLMAVKWLGNTGSHADDVSKDDALDGFELLESVIEELYERPNKANRLDEKSDAINSNNEKKH